jgi:hypothetical protein
MNSFGEAFDVKGYFVQEVTDPKNEIFIKIDVQNDAILDSLKLIRKKKWIDAQFKINNDLVDVKLKLHGSSSIHYQGGKYSYRILIKGKQLFEDMQEFTLIKSEDVPLAAVAANQMAVELDLIASSGRMVNLNINDADVGSYYLVEKIKSHYLAKVHGMEKTATIVNESDWDRKDNLLRNSPHMSDQDLFHGHLELKKGEYHKYAVNRYKLMSSVLKLGDTAAITDYLDANYMGRFLALASLFNDGHFISGDNLKLIYNHENGKFYPLFRKENGVNLFDTKVWHYKDIFKYQFPNYNQILFECQPDVKDAENLKIFKTALANNNIRSIRDSHLLNIITEKEKYFQILSNTYARNKSILLGTDFSRRAIEVEEIELVFWIKKLFSLASMYLNYARIYGSYDENTNTLDVVADSYTTVYLEGQKNK